MMRRLGFLFVCQFHFFLFYLHVISIIFFPVLDSQNDNDDVFASEEKDYDGLPGLSNIGIFFFL
jgi:hypothetical protein